MQAAPFDWEAEVRGWWAGQCGVDAALADSAVAFFRLSFQNMQCRDRAWFGCHETLASAVVGGIFLAAITRTGSEPGVWHVVDQDPPQLVGVEYRPVKSTADSEHPLKWAYAASLDALPGSSSVPRAGTRSGRPRPGSSPRRAMPATATKCSKSEASGGCASSGRPVGGQASVERESDELPA